MQLPTPLGWVRPTRTITLNQLRALQSNIASAPTVTAAVGNSPFVQKRSLDSTYTPASYNLELDERDILEPRKVVPLAAIPSYAANPATAPDVAQAKAKASAVAGPPPVLPNPYMEVLTAQQWIDLSAVVVNYTSTYQAALTATLGNILPPL